MAAKTTTKPKAKPTTKTQVKVDGGNSWARGTWIGHGQKVRFDSTGFAWVSEATADIIKRLESSMTVTDETREVEA